MLEVTGATFKLAVALIALPPIYAYYELPLRGLHMTQ